MSFKPENHIIKLQGKDYLEVKWRIVWFRDVNPNGIIETELLSYEPGLAIVKAIIKDGESNMLASGIAVADSRSKKQMWSGKEVMKAETAAIGRALAHAGYGTQFTGEDEGDLLSDSPVDRNKQQDRKLVKAKDSVWTEANTYSFLNKFMGRFPDTHHIELITNNGYRSLEELGNDLTLAGNQLMEWAYSSCQPVVVEYVRYVVNGGKYLEFTAVKNSAHGVIRGYGRTTFIKDMLNRLSPTLYDALAFNDYDSCISTTEWKKLTMPMIIEYEIGKNGGYYQVTGIDVPDGQYSVEHGEV